MVTQIITFRSKPEMLGRFSDVMQSVKSTLPLIPGCKAVRIHQGTDDPCVFTLIETWESEERHREHTAGLMANGSWAQISTLLTSEPESAYYAEL
jgi:quinol monooxygenase YgiN